MTTPNLDVPNTWVESLAGFTFSIEYQKWWDSAATGALSQVTMRLDMENVKSILDRVAMGSTGRTDAHDPVVAEADDEIHNQVWEAAILARPAHMHVNLHVTDWVAAQWEVQYLKPWLIGFPVRNYRIWSIL